jgi:isopropylmalate/homocitrate/citramalate synthase
MNTNKMEKMHELLKDAAFVEQMKNMESPEEFQAALAARGVELNDEEMMELLEECKKLAEEIGDELSEEQLESVVGGARTAVYYIILIVLGLNKIGQWIVKNVKVIKVTKKKK